jgi:putative transposase
LGFLTIQRFFKGLGGKPQFKKKLNRNSFTITGKNSLHFHKDFLKNKQFFLPKYDKPLKIKFSRDFNHLAVSSVTVSQDPSGKCFISFLVEENLIKKEVINVNKNFQQKTSYDLGLTTTAKVYNGNEFVDLNLPKLIQEVNVKLRKAQQSLSKKKLGSKNRNKQRIKVARLHEKKSNIIEDFYQKKSTQIINENQEIIREDLGIVGMLKNKKLSRSIHGVAWNRMNRMIDYKAAWHDRKIVKANQYYPSSKMCNKCKYIHYGLKLSDRYWECLGCKTLLNRDENACINLYNYKDNIKNNVFVVKSSSSSKSTAGTVVNACGENVRPRVSTLIVTKKPKAIFSETRISVLLGRGSSTQYSSSSYSSSSSYGAS